MRLGHPEDVVDGSGCQDLSHGLIDDIRALCGLHLHGAQEPNNEKLVQDRVWNNTRDSVWLHEIKMHFINKSLWSCCARFYNLASKCNNFLCFSADATRAKWVEKIILILFLMNKSINFFSKLKTKKLFFLNSGVYIFYKRTFTFFRLWPSRFPEWIGPSFSKGKNTNYCFTCLIIP